MIMRRKRELQNEKFLPTVELDPTTSRFVATHFEKITHFEKDFQSGLNLGPA